MRRDRSHLDAGFLKSKQLHVALLSLQAAPFTSGEMKLKTIFIKNLLAYDFLAGTHKVMEDSGKIISTLNAFEPGDAIALDFLNIRIVSGAYWNSMLPPLMFFAESKDIYPVLCGINEDSLAELKFVTQYSVSPVIVLGADKTPAYVGELDQSLKKTLDLVLAKKDVGAGELLASQKEKTGLPTWSNRLAALNKMRLIRRTKEGRGFRYRPVI